MVVTCRCIVLVGISGEKIEIDPVLGKGKFLNFKEKAVTHDTESVATCTLTDEKSSGELLQTRQCVLVNTTNIM